MSAESLFLFRLPHDFKLEKLDRLTLRLKKKPDKPFLCDFQVEGKFFSILESSQAEAESIVNCFPDPEHKDVLEFGQPFARAFSVVLNPQLEINSLVSEEPSPKKRKREEKDKSKKQDKVKVKKEKEEQTKGKKEKKNKSKS